MFGDLSGAQILLIIPAMMIAGVAIGFLAGFFGVGGGAVSVPVFYEVFRLTGNADDVAMPLAVGTSLAMIIPTAYLSAREHASRGTVNFPVLRQWALPMLVGVILGTAIAKFSDAEVFQIVFVVIAGLMSARLLLGGSSWQISETLPGRFGLWAYGALIGVLSALMGVGGGALSTMTLTLHGRPIHEAVSTSAAVGVLIAVPGSIGYVIAGWGNPLLPPDAIGYVSLLALATTLPATLAMTRMGVRAAHARTRSELSRWFGIFLLVVALRFVLAIAFDI